MSPWCVVAMLLICRSPVVAEIQQVNVDHDYVVDLAQKLAAKPYQTRPDNLPPFLQNLSYDDYHRIRFVEDHSLWLADQLPFRVQFFHPGNLFRQTVRIHEFAPGFSQRIPFVRNYFDYQDLNLPGRLPGSLEYAGFRVLGRLNAPDRFDEVISFLGASYYRALGHDQRYGMSARGLAIDFGSEQPEEFPQFVEFWLGKPAPDATTLVMHGLLDSPSATGAFTFDLTPGEETILHTHATFFFRQQVAVLGLAPLTSMFWFGENTPMRFGDFREEVHDSDGLLVAIDDKQRLWRPLGNPRAPRVTTFPCTVGFGLLQRDRSYYNYEDAEARYEKRPGAWVQLVGEWPAGRVRLVELPVADEYNDNVVAAFVPDQAPAAGASLDCTYEQHWTNHTHFGGPPAWVSSTRRSVHVDQHAGRCKFVLDFDPAGMADVKADTKVIAAISVPDPVKILTQHLFRNDIDGSWRLTFTLDAPDGAPPVDVSAHLERDHQPLSETWTTTWEQ